MKLPNKITSYKESILSKLPIILNELRDNQVSINDIYMKNERKFESIDQFIDALDCLYALGKIQYDEESERIVYVK